MLSDEVSHHAYIGSPKMFEPCKTCGHLASEAIHLKWNSDFSIDFIHKQSEKAMKKQRYELRTATKRVFSNQGCARGEFASACLDLAKEDTVVRMMAEKAYENSHGNETWCLLQETTKESYADEQRAALRVLAKECER